MQRGLVSSSVVVALMLGVGLGGCGGPDSDFLDPSDGLMNVRFLKDRDSVPPGRDRLRLEAEFFPEADGWRCHGHEIVVPEDANVRVDVGDRVDLRETDEWPLADDTTSAPAWLCHVDVQATAETAFVVLVGYRERAPNTMRVVVVGDVESVSAHGASLAPHVTEPDLPSAFVIEREVPAAHALTFGNTPGLSTGRFGADALYLQVPFPLTEPMHLTWWAHMPIGGGSSGGLQNNLRTFEAGDFRVASDGIAVSVQVAGKDADWTTLPHAFWTIRMSAQPAGR